RFPGQIPEMPAVGPPRPDQATCQVSQSVCPPGIGTVHGPDGPQGVPSLLTISNEVRSAVNPAESNSRACTASAPPSGVRPVSTRSKTTVSSAPVFAQIRL